MRRQCVSYSPLIDSWLEGAILYTASEEANQELLVRIAEACWLSILKFRGAAFCVNAIAWTDDFAATRSKQEHGDIFIRLL